MNRVVFVCCLIFLPVSLYSQQKSVSIKIDVSKEKGIVKHPWAWFGYDEPNYTYMKDGKKLLTEIAAFSPVPVYVRAHNLMTTGHGEAALKWGSTNMYTEDINGNPIYTWNIVDSIFDTYIQRKMKPLAQIGFMPEALSTNPQPYRHFWKPGDNYKDICTGWAYPPKDYQKWGELIYQWVKHCVDRYGKAEVESWYWELWNEPDGYYLFVDDRVKTYCKMYDYAADAVKRALPTARIGGPHVTGGAQKFMESFIIHCLRETNAVTGKVGTPFDFLAFHAKGYPKVVDNHVQMGMNNQLNDVYRHLKVIASFPETKNIPVIIGESDPEGCAACGMKTNPQNAYRNGTLYSSYTAASIPRIMEMNDSLGTNIIGAVNWSFEFENQPWFYGFRDLATNGVDKPVLNVFRMMAMMKGNWVEVSGDLAFNFKKIIDQGVHGTEMDINALASADKNNIGVLVWNYHDDDIHDDGIPVEIAINNISAKKGIVTHYRIDANHSNSYEVWKKMGSPENPSAAQIAELEKSGNLEMLSKPMKLEIKGKKASVSMQLPRQGVSFLKIDLQ